MFCPVSGLPLTTLNLKFLFSVCFLSPLSDCRVAMTSQDEEVPSLTTPTATSAGTISKETTAIARDSRDGTASSFSLCRPSPHHCPCPTEKEAEKEEIEEKGIIQEERRREEEGEHNLLEECEQDDEDEDDGSSDTSVLVVPYPELVPVVFFCLKQTTCPRSWCIRMVSSPYPLREFREQCLFKFFISYSVSTYISISLKTFIFFSHQLEIADRSSSGQFGGISSDYKNRPG